MNLKSILLCTVGATLPLVGCVDNNIDLLNIDTTSEFKINDLAIPLNIENEVSLNDVLDLQDAEKIKVVNINGEEFYALSQSGTFSSSSIEVMEFTAPAPKIEDSKGTFKLKTTGASAPKLLSGPLRADNNDVVIKQTFTLDSFDPVQFKISASGVDRTIRRVDAIEIKPMSLDLTLSVAGLPQKTSATFSTLRIAILKGLTISNKPENSTYNPETGELVVNDIKCNGSVATLHVEATGMDMTKLESKIVDQNFSLSSEVHILSADLSAEMTFTPQELATTQVPKTLDFVMSTTLSDMTATSFSGEIAYAISGEKFSIPPVQLSNLPNVLTNGGTNLKLANPQIYLTLSNPIASQNIIFETGFEVRVNRTALEQKIYGIDNNDVIRINRTGALNYVMSPTMPQFPLQAFAKDLTFVPFSDLSEIFSGAGIPSVVEVRLINPSLPVQNVTRFPLNKSYDGIEGRYEIFAPLAMKTGSVLVYSHTLDGWNSDAIKDIDIKKLSVDAEVKSTLPMNAELSITPIDANGNKISGVIVSKLNVPGESEYSPVTIEVKGDIRGLAGITIEAVVTPSSEKPMAPSQTISLKHVKVRISGVMNTNTTK